MDSILHYYLKITQQNGIYRFDRTQEFDLERLRCIQMRKAASED